MPESGLECHVDLPFLERDVFVLNLGAAGSPSVQMG